MVNLSCVEARTCADKCADILMIVPANGCELSGRGPLPHMVFLEPASLLSLASDAESPVRSSELLGRLRIGLSRLLRQLIPYFGTSNCRLALNRL